MKRLFCRWRVGMIFVADIAMVVLSWIATSFLCSNFHFPTVAIITFTPLLIFFQGSFFYFCGLYRGIWRFASIPDLIRILKAVMLGVLGIIAFSYLLSITSFLPTTPIVYGALLILFLSGPRVFFRWLKDYKRVFLNGQRILIVGAGNAGESLVRDLNRVPFYGYRAIAFVDDDIAKLGKEIHGIRVVGSCENIPKIVARLQIELILIAIPSASSLDMRRVVNFCYQAKIPFRTLPSLKELKEGRAAINNFRDVSLEDLLGREQVDLAWEKINTIVMNKTILVTGGGGSIGAELCTQLANLEPALLIVLDNSEYNLYLIDIKLRNHFPNLNFLTVLCSVTDAQGIKNIFAKYSPELVFHAAAYKHVPLLESQLRVAIHNNVIGTRIVAEAALEKGSNTFVLISTDKAVNPTSIMGATKRASEIICQHYNHNLKTRFVVVRFGNVLDSAGSAVPLFRKQLSQGGPLTVTHPEMTRFFMTIREASQLILQAASMGKGGETFVLDMGEPVKICYLAEQLIKLSGKTLGEDIEIHYSGMRPGEKLHEELFYSHEVLSYTSHSKICQTTSKKRTVEHITELLDELKNAYESYDEQTIFNLLRHLVPEYYPSQTNTQALSAENLQMVHS